MPAYVTVPEVKQLAPNQVLDGLTDLQLTRLTQHASRIIRSHTRAAVYATTTEGMPTDPRVRDAMRDAAATQIVAWAESGLTADVLSGGVTAQARVAKSTMNGASVDLDNSVADAARTHLLAGGLGVEAMMILDDVGLTHALPGVWR